MNISGIYYDGTGSNKTDTVLNINHNGEVWLSHTDKPLCHVDDIQLSPKVGKTPRIIHLPNHAQLQCHHHHEADALENKYFSASWLHKIESNKQWIFISVIAFIIGTVSFVKVGIPYFSEKIAYQIPLSYTEKISQHFFEFYDKRMFEPSQLSTQKKQELTASFKQLFPKDDEFNYQLKFRDGGAIGANAFALPDGTVVVTDQFVELADNINEINAVLFHEIGHVHERHGLRNMVEASFLSIFMIWLTGDLEGVSESMLSIVGVLMQTSFTRQHEYDADTYALENMQANNIDPIYFSSIMSKLAHYGCEFKAHRFDNNPIVLDNAENSDIKDNHSETSHQHSNDEKQRIEDCIANITSDEKSYTDYLSTHPPSRERIQRFYQQRFQ